MDSVFTLKYNIINMYWSEHTEQNCWKIYERGEHYNKRYIKNKVTRSLTVNGEKQGEWK